MVTRRKPEPPHEALARALQVLLLSLARLAVARGLPYATAEEMLKAAFVQAARDVQREPSAARIVSRISTATGINRREVTRLLARRRSAPARPRSLAAEVFAHWTTARAYRDRQGAPRVLPRQGEGASFEALAQSVTRDVHPRSLLDELVRLGLATHDTEHDTVALVRDRFVPGADFARMLGFLADNVGDHLSAAVHNVLADGGPRHLEQAVFAHGLSAASVQRAYDELRAEWQGLIERFVPMLEGLIEQDDAARGPKRRLRIGLYGYDEAQAPVRRRTRKDTE
jgi:hypothetical protein